MDKDDKEHYFWLMERYDDLIELILGKDYYTISPTVFSSNVEAFESMKDSIEYLKHNVKVWRWIAIIMTSISVLLFIARLSSY